MSAVVRSPAQQSPAMERRRSVNRIRVRRRSVLRDIAGPTAQQAELPGARANLRLVEGAPSSEMPPDADSHPLVEILERLARYNPDYSSVLTVAAEACYEIAFRDDRWMLTRIRKLLREGCNTLADLMEEFHFQRNVRNLERSGYQLRNAEAQVREGEQLLLRLLDVLIARGEVEERPYGLQTEVARGARLTAYFLTSEPAGSSYSPFAPNSHDLFLTDEGID